MSIKEVASTTEIGKIIQQNIDKPNVIFVFANSISLNTWADYIVSYNSTDGNGIAIEKERLITWSQFRKNYLIEHNTTDKMISDILRRLFVTTLLAENCEKCFLKSVVNPMYRKFWQSSVDILCQILPALSDWKEKYDYAVEHTNYKADAEDQDFEILYDRYRQYLENNNLYERAWCKLNLSLKPNQKAIIFFPEQINDFVIKYKQILKDLDSIELVELKANSEAKFVEYYPDVRTEIRMAVLKIRKLLETGNPISLEKIAIVVPETNFDSLTPYIEMECKNHGIPFTVSSARPLCINSDATIFRQIEKCVESNFYYENMSTLLNNPKINWNNKEILKRIIETGKKSCCLLNTENKDFWLDTLKNNAEDKEIYQRLSTSVKCIYNAKTFSVLENEIRSFVSTFIDENLSDEMSRCLSVLSNLTALEKSYQVKLDYINPLSIYNNILFKLKIAVNSDSGGISVIRYIDSVDSKFDYKFVISSSQRSIAVTYTPLDFIKNERKRLRLGIETNTSFAEDILTLLSSNKNTYFSCSKETFEGFAIPYIGFDAVIEDSSKDKPISKIIAELENYEFKGKCGLQWQSIAYEKNRNHRPDSKKNSLDNEIKQDIHSYITDSARLKNKSDASNELPLITQTDLAAFFPCPRVWLMQRFLGIKKQDSDISLLNAWDAGTINHRILQLYFENSIGKGKPIPEQSYLDTNKDSVIEELKNYTQTAIRETLHSELSFDCLTAQEESFAQQIFSFLCYFSDNMASDDSDKWLFDSSEVFRTKDNGKYKIFGSLDLLLYKETNPKKYAIVDFKNGSITSHSARANSSDNSNFGKIKDFQCSVYVLLQQSQSSDKNQIKKMSFYSISKQEKNDIIATKKNGNSTAKTPEEYTKTLEKLEEYCKHFASDSEITPKEANPEEINFVDTNKDCRTCNFKALCRTTFTIGGRLL